MEHGFSILMLIFGGMILLYAGLVAAGGYDLIPRGYATNPRDKNKYAKQFAKILLLTAMAPILGGLIGFLSTGVGIGITLLAFIFFIKYGIELTQITKLTDKPDPDERETNAYWKRAERDAWDAAEADIYASEEGEDEEDEDDAAEDGENGLLRMMRGEDGGDDE